MNIFVSWSGDRSRLIAQALREWLPYVLPSSKPWMSASDIDRGSRWSVEISKQLDAANVGIICLTPENLDAAWVLFEAGALSKALRHTLVCTYLFQVRPADIKGPLAQFQATQAEKNDTYKLVASLNAAMETDLLPDERLNKMFEVWWPDLERKLAGVAKVQTSTTGHHRGDRDILEEILSLSRRNDIRAVAPQLAALLRDELDSGEIRARRKSDDSAVVIDTAPLNGVGQVTITYPLFGTVSDFLDDLYNHLDDAVPHSTFGIRWALRDPKTGKEFREMGRAWAKKNNRSGVDTRRLEEVGIKPGMKLEAIPLISRESEAIGT